MEREPHRPHTASRRRLTVPLALTFVALSLLLTARAYDNRAALEPIPVASAVPFNAALAATGATDELDLSGVPFPLEAELRPGETLARALDRIGLGPQERRRLATALADHADLRRLRPGDRYVAFVHPDTGLARFELTLRGRGRVTAARNGEDPEWSAGWHPFERTYELRVASGTLEGSLEQSLRRAGAEAEVAYRMADVLQWDLDFSRDLRIGDRFEVLYEEVFLDGEPFGVGAILALTYENRGRVREAYRFGDGGYYDAEGRPLRRMFLRSPMRYTRITSGFTHRRFHPIHRDYRPHWGVDYAAPTGTPVRVTANGVVAFVGWAGGGGRTIRVRHPNGYMTAYLHLSRYGSGIRPGRRVRQGEVIGYVGASGTATGPHLDYRVQKNGRWINPLTLPNVPAEPIPDSRMADFLERRDALRGTLREGAPLPPPGDRLAEGPRHSEPATAP